MKILGIFCLLFLVSCFGNGSFPDPKSGAMGGSGSLTPPTPVTPALIVTTQDIVAAEVKAGEENLIRLDYEDSSGAIAANCSIHDLENVSVTNPCTCDVVGDCVVGVSSITNATGDGKFKYEIINTEGEVSNQSAVSFKIDRPFVTVWDTRNREYPFYPLNQIRLPVATGVGLEYDFTVEWGDGTSNNVTSVDGFTGSVHDYAVAGVYEVKIYGNFPKFYLNRGSERRKLLEIKSWGSIPWQDFGNAFHGAVNMQVSAQDTPDLTAVTSIAAIFAETTAMTGASANWQWNTSGIQQMTLAFEDAALFNGNISSWETSQVINMSSMFQRASSFNQDLSSWNVDQVVNDLNFSSQANSWTLPKPLFIN